MRRVISASRLVRKIGAVPRVRVHHGKVCGRQWDDTLGIRIGNRLRIVQKERRITLVKPPTLPAEYQGAELESRSPRRGRMAAAPFRGDGSQSRICPASRSPVEIWSSKKLAAVLVGVDARRREQSDNAVGFHQAHRTFYKERVEGLCRPPPKQWIVASDKRNEER